jgi:hypothetical protein
MRRFIRLTIGCLVAVMAEHSWASIPAAGGASHCFLKEGDTLRVIDNSKPDGECIDKLEVSVTWSQKGPAEAAGAAGPMRPQGFSASTSPMDLRHQISVVDQSALAVDRNVATAGNVTNGAEGKPGPRGTQGLQGPQSGSAALQKPHGVQVGTLSFAGIATVMPVYGFSYNASPAAPQELTVFKKVDSGSKDLWKAIVMAKYLSSATLTLNAAIITMNAVVVSGLKQDGGGEEKLTLSCDNVTLSSNGAPSADSVIGSVVAVDDRPAPLPSPLPISALTWEVTQDATSGGAPPRPNLQPLQIQRRLSGGSDSLFFRMARGIVSPNVSATGFSGTIYTLKDVLVSGMSFEATGAIDDSVLETDSLSYSSISFMGVTYSVATKK